MSEQRTQEVTPPPVTPTPGLPAGSSGPAPLGSSSTSAASGVLALLGHAMSATLALVALWRVLSWFPTCLAFVRTPTGVSHDPWAWLPLVLDLTAAIAIAAPVSLKSFLDFARTLRLPGRE